jgi:hypothetical protein
MKVMKFILIKNWKLIIANKPYIVIKCYTPPGFISDCDIRVVDIENESGVLSGTLVINLIKQLDK